MHVDIQMDERLLLIIGCLIFGLILLALTIRFFFLVLHNYVIAEAVTLKSVNSEDPQTNTTDNLVDVYNINSNGNNIDDDTPIAITDKTSPRHDGLSQGERACIEVLSDIFPDNPFVKTRPEWLRYPGTTGRMGLIELDLYCEELKIALEYNGRQHYEYVPHFHRKGIEQFDTQQKYDQWKVSKCKELNIYLIVVPYNIKHPYIRTYILNCLSNHPLISHLPLGLGDV